MPPSRRHVRRQCASARSASRPLNGNPAPPPHRRHRSAHTMPTLAGVERQVQRASSPLHNGKASGQQPKCKADCEPRRQARRGPRSLCSALHQGPSTRPPTSQAARRVVQQTLRAAAPARRQPARRSARRCRTVCARPHPTHGTPGTQSARARRPLQATAGRSADPARRPGTRDEGGNRPSTMPAAAPGPAHGSARSPRAPQRQAKAHARHATSSSHAVDRAQVDQRCRSAHDRRPGCHNAVPRGSDRSHVGVKARRSRPISPAVDDEQGPDQQHAGQLVALSRREGGGAIRR